MKKTILCFFVGAIFCICPVFVKDARAAAAWKPIAPEGYTLITWAKAPGIATFFKAPSGNGSIDFITRIYLPQNQIDFVASSTKPADWGITHPLFASEETARDIVTSTTDGTVATTTEQSTAGFYHNFAFERIVAEASKSLVSGVQFLWNAPYFNIMNHITDLSMALKYTSGTTTLISTGSRPENDMAEGRRMLIVNNKKGIATISDFDEVAFVSSSLGDIGFEGFDPAVAKMDTASAATGRLFLGIATSSKELVVYCSQQATVEEASAALLAAGVPVDRQLEADGGGSASCGYNLPGHFFVEPTRMLPLLMGAKTIVGRGNPTTDGLNVRSGPSTKKAVVMKLNKSDAFIIYEEKNGWYRIGDGQWVKKTLVKKL